MTDFMNAILVEDQPLVSIIIPTYNRASFVGTALEACLAQTYRNLEIIVVNDGSPDNTAEVVQSWVEKDARIRLINKNPNEGLPRGLNTGFQHANGAFWTWTSDDNTFLPHAIETMVKVAMQHQSPCLVHADYWILDDAGQSQLITVKPGETLGAKNIVGACFLYHREVGEAIGEYNPDLFLIEDMDYWMRISQRFPLVHVEEPLYQYLRHAGTLSVIRNTEIRLLALCIRKHYGYYGWPRFLKEAAKPILKMSLDQSLTWAQKRQKFAKAQKALF